MGVKVLCRHQLNLSTFNEECEFVFSNGVLLSVCGTQPIGNSLG